MVKVIDRAFKNEDILIFKFIKNVAISASAEHIKECLSVYLQDFLKLAMTSGKNDELRIEIIGILANINYGKCWEETLNQAFLDFLSNNISNQVAEDDIVLETIALVANICKSKKCAEILFKQKMLKKLTSLIVEKTEDDEFIVQLFYAVYIFLAHGLGIDFILQQDQLIILFLQYISDKNKVITEMNNNILNVIKEYDAELAEKIKEIKYSEHNKEWLESVNQIESQQMGNPMYGNQIDYELYLAAQQQQMMQEYPNYFEQNNLWDSDPDGQ
eukprot:TRINITY_DN1423_c0_g1_i1.p1 TRINITY_DN1423_c0_g1~~TRINITY_DN1423_c0_g1_i1.p1  ORF type:complete len:273 (+),score=63.42 TRINITY_DN1423_c0_g1_i1:203-1021(+)